MDDRGEVVKAIFTDKVILCGYCGHKLAEIQGLRQSLGNGKMWLKCSHKSAGVKCKHINLIEL
jgi:hypothetical protein